jgi:Protein of unknown function (DUF3300)
MRPPLLVEKTVLIALSLAMIIGGTPGLVVGQAPPSYKPGELDKLVSRIALYPDPLLAQILAAATYPDQIPDAAKWADDHHYLTADDLARAITADHLTWDPSVQALLPFPSVLAMMASNMDWTTELGHAFLAQQQEVMDAVQRLRKKAKEYGYLRTNGQVVVADAPYITIVPVSPDFIVVPVYDPLIVLAPAAPGFFVGAPWSSDMACRSASRFAPGDGGLLASSGTDTKYSSPMRVGSGHGPIAPPTCIITTLSMLGPALAAWSTMS